MAILKWEDYTVVVITLIVSLSIGLFYSFKDRKTRTTRQFILGDGKLAMVPVALSLMVSFESGIMMLGVPAEAYMYGTQWFMGCLGNLLGRLFSFQVLTLAQRKLDIVSINEYFELRYQSHALRMFSTVMNILASVNYLGTVTFVPAVTLQVVTDIPVWLSITALMGVVIVYTIIGGFKAVVWTDVFQAFLMFGGMLAILIKGTIESGGVASTWNTIIEKGRVNMFNFDPDPTLRQSFWSLCVGGAIVGLRAQFSQTTFQRIKATPTVASAKWMFLASSVLTLVISGLAIMEGAVMFAYYDIKGCDPLVAGHVTNPNQLVAKMVVDIFTGIPCLPGLFLAALFSASLSFYTGTNFSIGNGAKLATTLQKIVLLFGGMGVGVAFLVNSLKGPVSEIVNSAGGLLVPEVDTSLVVGIYFGMILETTDSCFYGATVALFLLGWLIPWATTLGAFSGGLTSVLLVGWISFGKITSSSLRRNPTLGPASTDMCPFVNVSSIAITTVYDFVSNTTSEFGLSGGDVTSYSGPQGVDVIYSVSYKWLTPIAIVVTITVGSIVSYLQARRPVDPSLVVPVCDYLCVCLPESIRKKLRCGVKYPNTVDEESEKDEATTKLNPPTLTLMTEKPPQSV